MKTKYGPYSPSRLEAGYCPLSFFRHYVDPLAKTRAKTENLPQARGSAVHEIFELMTDRFKLGEFPSLAETNKWIMEAVIRHPAAQEDIADIRKMVDYYLKRTPKDLEPDAEIELRMGVKFAMDNGQFVTYEDTTTFPGQTVTRYQFIECDYDDPDAFARGRADIMQISADTTTAKVWDHKTQQNAEEADTFQMGFYAWVISRCNPYLVFVDTILHFAQFGSYSDPFRWGPAELYQVEQTLLLRAGVIEGMTDWSCAVPNKNCTYCDMMGECPVKQDILVTDPVTGNQKFVKRPNLEIMDTTTACKVASEIHYIDLYKKSQQAALKAYVDRTGPIAIPGVVYGYKTDIKVNWEKINKSEALTTALDNLILKYGIDPVSYKGYSETLSKGMVFIDNENFHKERMLIMPTKVERTFGGRKS